MEDQQKQHFKYNVDTLKAIARSLSLSVPEGSRGVKAPLVHEIVAALRRSRRRTSGNGDGSRSGSRSGSAAVEAADVEMDDLNHDDDDDDDDLEETQPVLRESDDDDDDDEEEEEEEEEVGSIIVDVSVTYTVL